MPTLIIDGKEISVKPGTTIMEAAKLLGIAIPHLCYHPKLPVAGSCRMCMVEVEKMPKPVIACAMPVGEGMVVKTTSEMAMTARRAVMELLLINHPLDCPVCDQGGECKLQDLAMKYGPDRSRFNEHKREVPNPELGEIIETVMNRCIHCTRCIRFSREHAGVEELGGVWRGDHMAITTFVKTAITTELAGNLAETCPVGALNLKPFHFQARGWELSSTAGICGHCAVGCHLRRDHIEGVIKRVRSQRCDSINETWLCDKGRFSHDALRVNRLERPELRNAAGRLTGVTWQDALDRVAEIIKKVKPEEVAGLASPDQGGEELYAFQDFLRGAVGTPHLDHRLRARDFSGDGSALTRADLLMNTSLENLGRADCLVLVGSDPRFETPLLNLRLRRAAAGGARAFAITPRRLASTIPNLTQVVVRPGGELELLNGVLAALKEGGSGAAGEIAAALRGAQRPAVLLGEYAINHPAAEGIRRAVVAILESRGALKPEWNGFNRVAAAANAAAAQDLGVVPQRGPGYSRVATVGYNTREILARAAAGELKVLFLLGVDPLVECVDTTLAREACAKARVIYLGTHKGPIVDLAEVVLPGLASGEKESTLTNCEGRVQRGQRAVNGPVEAKEDWRILRKLSDRFATSLQYNTLDALREAMAAADHRYNLSDLAAGELPVACDHSPVTVGLPALSGPAVDSGLVLVMETPFYVGDGLTRNSALLTKLDAGGNRLRVNPRDAAERGVGAGQKAKLIAGDRSVEVEIATDEQVPVGVVFGNLGYPRQQVQGVVDSVVGGFTTVSLAGL